MAISIMVLGLMGISDQETLARKDDHACKARASHHKGFRLSQGMPEMTHNAEHYFLRDHNIDGSEWERLDELHRGINHYLKGALSFATIENEVAKILDIGAGSGAWSIQAAQLYPHAEVIAADLSPLPMRPFPDNVKYCNMDVLKPFTLEEESFDIIHMRILLYHLPQNEIPDFLDRALRLLRPNGWLLIEDFGRHSGHETSGGPAQPTFENIFIGMLRAKGLNPVIGEHIAPLLENTNVLSEVHSKCIQLVLSTDQEAAGTTPEIRELSNAVRTTIEKVVKNNIGEDLKLAGVTPELQEAWLNERADPAFKTIHDFWFTWSRKA